MMKKYTKLLAGLAAVLSLSVLTVGCDKTPAPSAGGEPKSDGKVDVGIVLPTKEEPRWTQDETRFQEALKDTPYKAEILFSQNSANKEKNNIDTLISKGIKVLVICPYDAASAAAAAEAAKQSGVKVISYDRLITGTDAVDYYVTFDSHSVGAAQAKYLVDHASGTKGQPLYLYAGDSTDNNAFLFFEGAWKVLQPKIADGTFKIANSSEAVALKDKSDLTREEIGKIIGQVSTKWKFDVAKNKAESDLTAASAADKGNVLVLAPNDGTARSIADVFKADTDVKSYVITGQDAEKASIQYIIDGKQSMTVLKDVRTLVKDTIAMTLALLKNEPVTTDAKTNNGKTDVNTKQITIVSVDKDNVKKEIFDSAYYPASEFKGL